MTAEVPGMERKLTAILNADVKGYSRLMGEDEAATVQTLSACRELMSGLVRQHGGRVVDMTGDNLLAEFASVVGAVRCAVEVQEELKARNAELPDHRRMEFRIGINLGDVIVDGERIYGDGVNVAARVQGLADGGGICVSASVYDQVKNKLAFSWESLGEHAVKNITERVRVYRVLLDPTAAVPPTSQDRKRWPRPGRKVTVAVLAALALFVGAGVAVWNVYFRPPAPAGLELPDRPSIAVLPFANLSADPQQEHFADGMTEDLITTLSKVSGVFVIASNSVFTYKGKRVKVQQVSRELGVRYVLEGSVRKSGDRMRVTAQLIDAAGGHHLWAERYDRELKEVFALQDELTQKIVTALEVKLTEGEQARIRRQTTANVEAWETYSRGVEQDRRSSRESNAEAQRLYEKAIALDPKFAAAYAALAFSHASDARLGYSPSPARSLERAAELAQKALALDESLADGYAALSYVHLTKRQHQAAVAAAERAIALSPNGADANAMLAWVLNFSGRPEEAIALVKKAMRLSPVYPGGYLWILGHAYRLTGRYDEALTAIKRWRDLNPENPYPHAGLAGIYILLDREPEARAAMAQALRLDPTISLERVARGLPYKDPKDLERTLEIFRRAGLK